MDSQAKLAADTLRKMANFKQMLAFPYDTGKIINGCANLIESLSAQLDQVTRERDAIEKDFAQAAKIMFMEDVPGACDVCMENFPQYGCEVCEFRWRGMEVEDGA